MLKRAKAQLAARARELVGYEYSLTGKDRYVTLHSSLDGQADTGELVTAIEGVLRESQAVTDEKRAKQ